MNTKYIETIKCDDFKVYNLEYHKKRVANTIGKNIALEEYIYPPSDDLLKCRFVYTKDEIIEISYEKYIKKESKKFKVVFDNNILYPYKTLQRDNINNLYKQKDNADEILIFKNSLLTDSSIANIAIFYDNQWLTPTLPLLKGTTRDRYLNNNILKTANITLDMLKGTKKLAFLNAMIDFDIIENFHIL